MLKDGGNPMKRTFLDRLFRLSLVVYVLVACTGTIGIVWGAGFTGGATSSGGTTYDITTPITVKGAAVGTSTTPLLGEIVTPGLKINADGSIVTVGTGTGSVAGNARGAGAVDLQTTRAVAASVASGANSFVVGENNKASAQYSVAMGYNNAATGIYGSTAIGYSNTVSGDSATGIGANNTVSGSAGAVAIGNTNNVTGSQAFAGGYGHTVPGANNVAFGKSNVFNANSNTSGILSGTANTIATGTCNVISGGASCQITGGNYNVVGGGQTNVISSTGQWNSILGGQGSTISAGDHHAILGGSSHTISTNATLATICGGFMNVISGTSAYCAFVTGQRHTVTGGSTFTTGYGNTNSALYGAALGIEAKVDKQGQMALGATKFAAVGDSQWSNLIAGRLATDSVATRLTCDKGADGAANRWTIASGSCWVGTCNVSAVAGDAARSTWGCQIVYRISRTNNVVSVSNVSYLPMPDPVNTALATSSFRLANDDSTGSVYPEFTSGYNGSVRVTSTLIGNTETVYP
jgi:trimeric autotransporter adhesin